MIGLCKLQDNQGNVGLKLMEQMELMKYLEAMIGGDGSMDREVELRIGMAARTVGAVGSSV